MAKGNVVDSRKPVGKKGVSNLVKYLVKKSKQKRKKILDDLKFKPGIRKKVKQKVKKKL